MYSDTSDGEYNENDFYHRKYRLLFEKCESIQQVTYFFYLLISVSNICI